MLPAQHVIPWGGQTHCAVQAWHVQPQRHPSICANPMHCSLSCKENSCHTRQQPSLGTTASFMPAEHAQGGSMPISLRRPHTGLLHKAAAHSSQPHAVSRAPYQNTATGTIKHVPAGTPVAIPLACCSAQVTHTHPHAPASYLRLPHTWSAGRQQHKPGPACPIARAYLPAAGSAHPQQDGITSNTYTPPTCTTPGATALTYTPGTATQHHRPQAQMVGAPVGSHRPGGTRRRQCTKTTAAPPAMWYM
jgi:hypothetical protein